MWELAPAVRLVGPPRLTASESRLIAEDFTAFSAGLPQPLEPLIAERYGIDLASEYAGFPLKNPFGKASGQLSLAPHQVQQDAAAGLGFVVLKTVIAQDAAGEQSMHAWAIPETRMLVEPIRSRKDEPGWTVTWKGRGWFGTFDSYRAFFRQALVDSRPAAMLIIPSVKYHLPGAEESRWRAEEYAFTTARLLETWDDLRAGEPMPLEKDFSPTLAGSEKAAQQAKILEWLREVPALIHRAAPGRVRVGLKIFNTLFDDDFQLRMLREVHNAPHDDRRADYLTYANRLFDPDKRFEDKVGVAYGGPDLSDRNLSILENFVSARSASPLPLSATGDIHSGRIAAEYLLRGASSFQAHTIFQRNRNAFSMQSGNKSEVALHHLLFHPEEGLLAWIMDLRRRLAFPSELNIAQIARWCRDHWADVSVAIDPARRITQP